MDQCEEARLEAETIRAMQEQSNGAAQVPRSESVRGGTDCVEPTPLGSAVVNLVATPEAAPPNTPQQGANRDASAGQSHVAGGSASPAGRGADGPSARGAAPVLSDKPIADANAREFVETITLLTHEPAAPDTLVPLRLLLDARAALADALELLEGWIALKCAKKYAAEHTAHVEKLRRQGGLQ